LRRDRQGTSARARGSSSFKLLYFYGVLFDVLGYSRSGEGDTVSDSSGRLYLSVALGLTGSTALALVLAPVKDPFTYALTLGSLSAVFVAVQASSELLPFVFPPDQAIVGHLPVSSRVRLAARYAVLGTVVLIQFANWNLAPAIVASFSLHSVRALVAYLVASFAMCGTMAAAALALNVLAVSRLRPERVREAMVYVQVLSVVAILLVVFGLPKLAQGQGTLAGDWLRELGLWWPPAWYAHLFCALSGHSFAPAGVALAGIGSLAAAVPFVLLAPAYHRFLSRLVPAPDAARAGRWSRTLLRGLAHVIARRPERPFFHFAVINFRRDRGFRLRAYPLLIYPIAILVFAGHDTPDRFFIMMLQVVALYMVVIVALVPFSDHPRAAWILHVLPIESRSSGLLGVEKAFLATLLAPSYALVAVALCFVWDPRLAIPQTLLAALLGSVVVAMAFQRLEALPFSQEFRGDLASQDIVSRLMGYFMLVVITGLLQGAFGRTVPGFVTLALGSMVAVILLHRRAGALR
jgi:hypothetical protein